MDPQRRATERKQTWLSLLQPLSLLLCSGHAISWASWIFFLFNNLQHFSFPSACPLSPKTHINLSICDAFWWAVPWVCYPSAWRTSLLYLFWGLLSRFIWWCLVFVWEEAASSWSASPVPMKAGILHTCHQPSKPLFSEVSMLIHPCYRNSRTSSAFCLLWTFASFNRLLSGTKASGIAQYQTHGWTITVHGGIMVLSVLFSILKMLNRFFGFLTVTEQWIDVLSN